MALLALMLAGCGERATISAPATGTLTSHDLVGEAALALDATAHFVLPPPRTTHYPQISAGRPSALADAYLGDYGHFILPYFERQHGGPIDLSTTRTCGAPLYAATPYDDASLDQASGDARRLLGPHWLVSFCSSSGEPVISIGVSALATEEKIETGQSTRLSRDCVASSSMSVSRLS